MNWRGAAAARVPAALSAGYVARMRQVRRGTGGNYPHEILDPRDLKFYRNQGDLHWQSADDPLRAGGTGCRWSASVWPKSCCSAAGWSCFRVIAVALLARIARAARPGAVHSCAFFRDPQRRIPAAAGVVVSPADGQVFSIREVEHDDYLNGPAVVIDIFLSVFNVHINRVPIACRVLGTDVSSREVPQRTASGSGSGKRIAGTAGGIDGDRPRRVMRVRQITGAIARRIVCWVGREITCQEEPNSG